MKRLMFFSVMLALAWSLSSEALGQNKSVRPTVRDSSSRIVTGDVLDGIKYYIKIVPVDTTRQEKMPTYKPGAKKFSPMETVEVDKEPVPIKRVEPEYPEEARRAGMEGTVWINCLVGTDGKVKKAHVLRADAEIFIAPSIAAALQWRFFPAQLKGKPVAVWAAIPFRFKLEK